jgi:hypothetical protein
MASQSSRQLLEDRLFRDQRNGKFGCNVGVRVVQRRRGCEYLRCLHNDTSTFTSTGQNAMCTYIHLRIVPLHNTSTHDISFVYLWMYAAPWLSPDIDSLLLPEKRDCVAERVTSLSQMMTKRKKFFKYVDINDFWAVVANDYNQKIETLEAKVNAKDAQMLAESFLQYRESALNKKAKLQKKAEEKTTITEVVDDWLDFIKRKSLRQPSNQKLSQRRTRSKEKKRLPRPFVQLRARMRARAKISAGANPSRQLAHQQTPRPLLFQLFLLSMASLGL